MELRPYTDADLALTEALETDPTVMHELGGPTARSRLPPGRGVGSGALALPIERARTEPRFETMHAFPAVTNAPSNALCRTFGFSLLGQRDFTYAGRPLRCNHWVRALARRSAARSTAS
jgi:hypothetical protein